MCVGRKQRKTIDHPSQLLWRLSSSTRETSTSRLRLFGKRSTAQATRNHNAVTQPGDLMEARQLLMAAQIEEALFMCGSPLLPEGHSQESDIVIRSSLSCSSEVERAYFTSKKALRPLCFVCWVQEPASTSACLSAAHQSVHMPRVLRLDQKKKPSTCDPVSVGATAPSSKKRKHQ